MAVIDVAMLKWFDMANSVLCAVSVREDLGSNAFAFSRSHPFSCCASTLLSVFAGGMISNGLLGDPIVDAFKNTQQIVITLFAWLFVFYTPLDLGYKLSKVLHVNLVLSVMQEIYRSYKVDLGVQKASEAYPNACFIVFAIGLMRGNGGAFAAPIGPLIRGVWTPNKSEFLQPSSTTKACLLASAVFLYKKNLDVLIDIPVEYCMAIFFVALKLTSVYTSTAHPFAPIDNALCSLLTMWDHPAEEVKDEAEKDKSNKKEGKED